MTSASASATQSADDYARFAIGFDPRDRARLHALIDEVLDSGRWSEGEMVGRFEAAWEEWNGVPAVAASSWAGGALAALDFAQVRGETVLCPSNTFMATPLAAIRAGAEVQFVDCNREDLCMSYSQTSRLKRSATSRRLSSSSTSAATSPSTWRRSPPTAASTGSS